VSVTHSAAEAAYATCDTLQQWPFHKTGTLASQADIGVWVQAPERLQISGFIIPGEILKLNVQNPAV